MSTIAQQFQHERSLQGAPRVHAVSRAYTEAAALALAHARAHLQLPAVLPISWVSHPGGNSGETWWWADGRVEIYMNAGADLSPREIARVVLHECRHVADGPHPGLGHWAAEDRADAFAAFVMDPRETTQDFSRLDGRRPLGRR